MTGDHKKDAHQKSDPKAHSKHRDRPKNNHRYKQDPFIGNLPELQGFVYTYDGYARASQFRRTTEKIGEWTKQNCAKYPLDVWRAINSLSEPDMDEWRPEAPDDPEDVVDAAVFKEEVQEYGKRKRAFRDNSTKVYTVILGQCSEATKAKLEAREDWESINEEHQLVNLLKAVKSLLHNQLENDRYEGLTAYESLKSLMHTRQQRYEDTSEYRKRFTAATEVLEHIGISFGAMFQGIADKLLESEFNTNREDATDQQATEAETKAGESVLAVMFLKQSCQARYAEINRDLQNDFLKRKDSYPSNVTAAYNILVNWRQWSLPQESTPPLDGVAFTIDGDSRNRNDGGDGAILTNKSKRNNKRDTSNLICNNCQEVGHVWRKCPKPFAYSKSNPTETLNAIDRSESDEDPKWGIDEDHSDEVILCQYHDEVEPTSSSYEKNNFLPRGSVGLDSLSTVDLFCDARMLTNIRKASQTMTIRCNAGHKEVKQIGHLAGYGDVWYDKDAVANILSLGRVTKRFKVTFNSSENKGFILHLPGGRTRCFRRTS